MNDFPKGSKEHAAAELGIDPSEVVSVRHAVDEGCVYAVTAMGQKVRLVDGQDPEVLTGPGSAAGEAKTVEAPALPLPAEEPDDLPVLEPDESDGSGDPDLHEHSDANPDDPDNRDADGPTWVHSHEGGQEEHTHSESGPDRFEVFKGEDGEFYIRRFAANGEEVATSEGHKRRKDAVDEAEREAGDPSLVTIV